MLEERNSALHLLCQTAPEDEASILQLKHEVKQVQKRAADAIALAKSKCYADLCEKIHDMSMKLRMAWEYIRILTGGEAAHHRKSKNMAMKMGGGPEKGHKSGT